MVLPLFIRSAEEGFRAVPDSYRAAAAATGVSRLGMLRYVLLPAATPGLVVGLVLSIGRALAETAALLFTSGYVARMPDSLGDSGRVLPIHIYDLSMHVAGGTANAYSSALVLIAMLLAINGLAALAGRRLLARNLMTT
ncbi:phosphate ABC transporter permease [Salinisphaera sp. PC39]|uniref:ABC transporter permease subunit n=1 Tax=Salinisphaera sp. PC39 TaxID=1304156 RepID=UPI00333F1F19